MQSDPVPCRSSHLFVLTAVLSIALCSGEAMAAPAVTVSRSANAVECYEYLEVTLNVRGLSVTNPFTEVTVTGEFSLKGETPKPVTGFCDDLEGKVFRIRFMPSTPGKYEYSVQLSSGGWQQTHRGSFTATRKAVSPGPVRVDPAYPFHFIRQGTGQHWFWNATTTYQLLAWDDDTIKHSVNRLADLGVNRLRVALAGRTKDGKRWNEPLVQKTTNFQFKMEPWPAARPDDLEDPGYDVSRFNVDFFRKTERMLRLARDRDVIISIIFYVDGADKGVDPFGKQRMGGADEQRYYQYVAARFSAFPNIMWDVTNEYHLFRDEAWVNQMGALLKESDPYDHIMSVHGHGQFPFRESAWADFAMFQSWDEHGGYGFMLKNRREQQATGKPKPQVNEEYGYEDHYPYPWGEKRLWPTRIGDNRRRLAWTISMAGCYQTTGERANDGTGAGPDTGGGWINGRGNEHMTMLIGYRNMVRFFTSFAWWQLEPRDDLAGKGTLLLATPGRMYAAYVQEPGTISFRVAPGRYRAQWYNPRIGSWLNLPDVQQAAEAMWTSPSTPDAGDWALLLESDPGPGKPGSNR